MRKGSVFAEFFFSLSLQNDSKLGYKSAIDWSNGHLGHAWWAAKISNILINNGPT